VAGKNNSKSKATQQSTLTTTRALTHIAPKLVVKSLIGKTPHLTNRISPRAKPEWLDISEVIPNALGYSKQCFLACCCLYDKGVQIWKDLGEQPQRVKRKVAM
jgi:hypothetical protein